jgi:rhodanese-related sulfurtransferase
MLRGEPQHTRPWPASGAGDGVPDGRRWVVLSGFPTGPDRAETCPTWTPARERGGQSEVISVTDGGAIDRFLAQARAGLDRVEPVDLPAEVAAGAVVIDIRPVEQRTRDGDLPGAVVVDRNVLEWRLDPTSPHHLPVAIDTDVRFVLVCIEGYGSRLAAATLRELGLSRATDLVGGFQAWAVLRFNPGSRAR